MFHNKFFIYALIVVLFISFSNTFAKEDKALKSKVAEVLNKFPAQNSLQRDQLSADLIQLGSDGILIVCRTLVPPGTGDDTNARFALNGLSIYANRGGAEIERKLYAKTLIKGLKSATDNEVKAFLIRQLQLVGKDESVKTLSKYLKDKRLCEPATQALVTIRSKNAKKTLVKSLGSVDGANRITIIKALGEIRCKSAVKKLLKYAESKEDKLRQTTLYALANIGDPSAEAVLSKVLISASAYERATSPSLFLPPCTPSKIAPLDADLLNFSTNIRFSHALESLLSMKTGLFTKCSNPTLIIPLKISYEAVKMPMFPIT